MGRGQHISGSAVHSTIVFPPLEPLYRSSVEALDPGAGLKADVDSLEYNVITHVMSFFWRGVDGTEHLARELLLRGGENLRHSAFDFIGRSLMNSEGEVPAESLARIRSLWEWWRQDGAERRLIGKEVETFGWWFASEQFDWGWAEAQAVWVLVPGQRLSQIMSWWKVSKNESRTIRLPPSGS